jgi:hypothetical protein
LKHSTGFSYGHGLVFRQHSGARGPIALINLNEGDVPDCAIQQAPDRFRRAITEIRILHDFLQGFADPDVVELDRGIRLRRWN